MKIYRIENLMNPDRGLWYTRSGTLDPLVTKLRGSSLSTLPMPLEEDVVGSFSGCESLTQMQEWFSFQDLVRLNRMGFCLFIYDVSTARTKDNHLLFRMTDVIQRVKGSLDQIYSRSVLE